MKPCALPGHLISLNMANCLIVQLRLLHLTLGNQITDIRKAATKARPTLTKGEYYFNILKNLAVLKIIVKNIYDVVAWDIL